MTVVLPMLRLWLLLLNVYGTFKGLKRLPSVCAVSRRGRAAARSGRQPTLTVRAAQLRKRELKGRLAIWVVWATFIILERPLDCTLGLLTPFYNELKCVVLLFLLVSRSHGAEAIFLHLIHPSVRPYVPAVDNTLAALQSIFDLLSLVFSLPWEFISDHWHYWKSNWGWILGFPRNRNLQPVEALHPEVDREPVKGRGLCRHQHGHEIQEANMRKAEKQTQAIFQEIEDAQNKVRMRTRSQASKKKLGVQPGLDLNPKSVGLRTGEQVLEHSMGLSLEVWPRQQPGSTSTGVHHLDPTVTSQLPQGSPTQHEPPTQTVFRSPPTHIQTASSQPPLHTHSSGHEIWYPPAHASRSTPPVVDDTGGRRTPSPASVSMYPPLPAAYPFTPRPRDSNFRPPPPPRIVTPPDLVTPTPRRVSTSVLALNTLDAFEGIDQFAEQRPNLVLIGSKYAKTQPPGEPPSSGRRELPYKHVHGSAVAAAVEGENFFGDALEPSIREADMDMDVGRGADGDAAATLSNSMSDSSANANANGNSEAIMGKGSADADRTLPGQEPGGKVDGGAWRVKGRSRTIHGAEIQRSQPPAPMRRSARVRNGDDDDTRRVPAAGVIKTDEFGFTLRTTGTRSALGEGEGGTTVMEVTGRGLRGKKPLARTKPVEKPKVVEGPTPGESSDEEGQRKRRKLGSRGGDHAAAGGSRGVPEASNFVNGKEAGRVTRRKAADGTIRKAGSGAGIGDGKNDAEVMKQPLDVKKRDRNRRTRLL